MISIQYAPTFVRIYRGLDKNLKSEVKEKIELFRNRKNHNVLKVHKLHGRLNGRFSFYINYKIRIVFRYEDKNEQVASLLFIGGHDDSYRQ